MACGAAIAPYAPTPPTAGALDDDANSALEVLASDAEGAWFAQRFDWGLWEKSDDLLILLGSADPAVGERVGEFGSVAFERHNEGWVPSGWGTCRWLSLAEGYGPAEWTIDPANPPTPDSSSISVLATEHACAGGKVPEGREVIPLLEASSKGITIVILVERIAGAVTCPSNPPFRLTIDIGVPMGQRALYDGHAIPPILRLER
jgi:hypothetical protein